MTTIFTKGDLKRKFLTVESKDRTEMSYLQSELDTLEAEDCLIVDVKVLKSLVIDDSLYHMTYMIEYLSPLYEVIATYSKVDGRLCNESIGVYMTIEEAEAAERKHGGRTRIVKHSPRVIEFS